MLLELHKFLHFAENENEKKRTIKVTFPNTVIKQTKTFGEFTATIEFCH